MEVAQTIYNCAFQVFVLSFNYRVESVYQLDKTLAFPLHSLFVWIWFADSQLLLVHGATVFGRPVFSLVSMSSLSSGITRLSK